MKYLNNVLGILGIGLLFIGCEKSEPMSFQGKPAVVFDYQTEANSKGTFSFLGKSGDIGEVKVPVIINGFPEDRDRNFDIEVVTDTITDAVASGYKIEQGVVKAGRVKDSLLVKLYKTDELETKVVNLYLRVKDNNEFERGIREKQYYQLSWSNQAIMPTWGTYFRTFFCSVGSTKAYRIFVETTGLTNFVLANFRIYQQAGAEVLGKKFGDYIRTWNAANPNDILVHDDGTSKGLPITPRY
jgi:hypothetical protein